MKSQWTRQRWVSVVAFVILCSVPAIVGVHEALAVSAFDKAGLYPFGGEGPAGDIWYYHSAVQYFWVNAISGTLWSLVVLVTMYAAWAKNYRLLLNCVGVAMVLFVLELLVHPVGTFVLR